MSVFLIKDMLTSQFRRKKKTIRVEGKVTDRLAVPVMTLGSFGKEDRLARD